MLKLRIREIQFYERPVTFRMPFRFGVVTLTEEIELFVRMLVELDDGRTGWGVSAEVLAPKWFDKNPDLTREDNEVQLRDSLGVAALLYTAESFHTTPFRLFSSHYSAQQAACKDKGLNPLIASFGPALLDRAVLDAACKILGCSVFDAVSRNLPGVEAIPEVPELNDFDFDPFLRTLKPAPRIHARHTVGLVDPIISTDLPDTARLNDGLPETLEEVVKIYRNRYYKLKLCGEVERDVERLKKITGVLNSLQEGYYTTLDGNEQYEDVDSILEFWTELNSAPELARLRDSVLFVEQPIKRQNALSADVGRISEECPVIIDESDQDLDAFPRSTYFGYRGVSSKQCKGIYKSIINSARCHLWNSRKEGPGYLMSGEDLTTMPGIAVQQDLALATMIGLTHLERNGHHYVRGMAHAPADEQDEFLESHPDLYLKEDGLVRLRITNGLLRIQSLQCSGFGSRVLPNFSSMERIR